MKLYKLNVFQANCQCETVVLLVQMHMLGALCRHPHHGPAIILLAIYISMGTDIGYNYTCIAIGLTAESPTSDS